MQHNQSLDLNALNTTYWKRRVQQCKAEFRQNQPRPILPPRPKDHQGSYSSQAQQSQAQQSQAQPPQAQPSGYRVHESTQGTKPASPLSTKPISSISKPFSPPIKYEVR